MITSSNASGTPRSGETGVPNGGNRGIEVVMPKGVKLQEIRVGDGDVAERGTIATVRHEGTLKRGEKVCGGTETIDLSRRETIAGLRYGIEGMRVGGLRQITVSPHLAYGEG